MKRLMIATALTASMSTAALAAIEAQEAQIEQFLPEVDASTLTDVEVATAMSIINGTDTRSGKLGKLQSIVNDTDYMMSPAMLTEAEVAMLEEAAPGVNLATRTQGEVNAALAVLKSSDNSNAEAKARAILMDDGTPMGDSNSATEGEMVTLQQYLPDMVVSDLTEPQLNSALAIVYSGDSNSEISAQLNALYN